MYLDFRDPNLMTVPADRVGGGLPDSSSRVGRGQLMQPFTSRSPAH